MSLDGVWDFAFTGATALLAEPASITVPGVWQAQFPELRNTAGTGTYRRRVDIAPDWHGRRLFLIFDGIFHESSVSIDGAAVGTHQNGWTPFEVDITDAVQGKPAFHLEVIATVPDDRAYAEGGLGISLHGKQDWYGLQGGIWKSARIEARQPAHISRCTVTAATDLMRHTVRVGADLSVAADGSSLVVTLEQGGKVLARAEGDANLPIELEARDVTLWSPDQPALYDVRVALIQHGAAVDEQVRTVGFRQFVSRDGKLLLNGTPFYMFGALDQDWHPEQECRAPDPAFLEQRFVNAKALGLNVLRCHVKIPDPLYFELADRIGIIVWLDMPYMEFLAPRTRDQLVGTFEAAVANHGHHPAICIWTIINEGWGIDLDDNPDDRAWLTGQFDRLKRLVPTCLLVDNSPCFPRNYHLKTEIEDFHWYNSWPSQNDQFQRTTDQFAARPTWTWSPHGDAQRRGDEPLIVSEFGVWGLPHPSDILERDGSEPWWFESGHDWNNGCGYPHGMDVRFRDAQLGPIFGDLDGFVAAAQETQFRALKHQIETLRFAEPIRGYVITELNDTQWEANGLMDARNNVRAFGDRLAALQASWLVVARPARTALRAGETFELPVRLTGAGALPVGAMLHWKFGAETGASALDPGPTGSGEVWMSITAPVTEDIAVLRLELEARDGEGGTLGSNSIEFCIVPRLTRGPSLYPADAGAASILAAIAWPGKADAPDNADVIVATRLTAKLRGHLLTGRKVLLIANDDTALIEPERTLPAQDLANFPKMRLQQREGTYWDGRWMGAFSWRRIDGAWAELPNGPMLDEHWGGLLPNYVLTGFRSTAFGGLVDAGVAAGWLHKAAAFTKRSFLGTGWLTATTFEFTAAEAQANPLAPHVLLALVGS